MYTCKSELEVRRRCRDGHFKIPHLSVASSAAPSFPVTCRGVAAGGDRTHYLWTTHPLLYQLSYLGRQ